MSDNALTPVRRLWVRERFGHGRKQATATAWLDRFEWDATMLAYRRNATLSLMAHESDNDGRSVTEAPGLVNGTEVRWSERWLIPSDPTEDYSTVTTRMGEDGERTPFTAHLTNDDNASPQARKPLSDNELNALDSLLRAAQARAALDLPTQASFD